ncbi:unnamed protein product [Closterium sp. Yama58-4]|nr:unnamed protein product [Closterium sp. Yama58-4]
MCRTPFPAHTCYLTIDVALSADIRAILANPVSHRRIRRLPWDRIDREWVSAANGRLSPHTGRTAGPHQGSAMPYPFALYACEWCRRRFTSRSALFAHKACSGMCRRIRSRYIRNGSSRSRFVLSLRAPVPQATTSADARDNSDDDDPPDAMANTADHLDQASSSAAEPEAEELTEAEVREAVETEEREATVAEADRVPEADFRPTERFDTLMEVFRFIIGCNNGRGLSNDSTVWLLNLLREERLNLALLQHWNTLHAVVKYGLSQLMATREYETHAFTLPNWPTPFEVTATSGKEVSELNYALQYALILSPLNRGPDLSCCIHPMVQAVLELLRNPANAEGFVLFAREENYGAGRTYSTLETATYWEEAQRAAVAMFGEGTVVVPIILSSDATMLSGNERTKVWAVYISIANIPLHRRWQECGKLLLAMLPFPLSQMTPTEKTALFQAAMKIVLADLVVASHTGMAATDPNGVARFVVPLLFSYVADYPETCKVSCTQQLGSVRPCSLCYVQREHLRDMDRDAAEMRTVEKQEGLLDDPAEAARYATMRAPGNTYLTMGPDILHAIFIGWWLYIRDALRGNDRMAVTKDGQMAEMYPDARLADIALPSSGNYWVSGANYTASEHAAVMMVAPFVMEGEGIPIKRAALVGVLEWLESCVRAPFHTDASLTELDQRTRRMVQVVEAVFPRGGQGYNLLKVHLLTHLPDFIRRNGVPREFSAAVYENAHIRTCKLPITEHLIPLAVCTCPHLALLSQAMATGIPQLTRASRSLTSQPQGGEPADSVFDQLNVALGGILAAYDSAMRAACLRPFPAMVHTALALPAGETDLGTLRPHYVRAAASLHGHKAFSCVEYETDAGQQEHGRLLMLLEAERDVPEDVQVEVAVIQRLVDQGLDAHTGCRTLSAPLAQGGLAVIEVAAIRRAVHCVPSFERRGLWYLNRWAYRCTESLT